MTTNLPDEMTVRFRKRYDCSKGENPPARGAVYDIVSINDQSICGGGQEFKQHYEPESPVYSK